MNVKNIYTRFLLLIVIVFSTYTLQAQDRIKLTEGMKAPNFALPDQKGKTIKLSSFRDKSVVVVYFYPKAGTSGCTKQACGIRDEIVKFKEKNIVVLGVSTDSKKELKRFVQQNKLNFPLLSDFNKVITSKYGVLRDDGKAKRVTFIIDKNGIIAKIIEVTEVSTHSTEVFEIASQL